MSSFNSPHFLATHFPPSSTFLRHQLARLYNHLLGTRPLPPPLPNNGLCRFFFLFGPSQYLTCLLASRTGALLILWAQSVESVEQSQPTCRVSALHTGPSGPSRSLPAIAIQNGGAALFSKTSSLAIALTRSRFVSFRPSIFQ